MLRQKFFIDIVNIMYGENCKIIIHILEEIPRSYIYVL